MINLPACDLGPISGNPQVRGMIESDGLSGIRTSTPQIVLPTSLFGANPTGLSGASLSSLAAMVAAYGYASLWMVLMAWLLGAVGVCWPVAVNGRIHCVTVYQRYRRRGVTYAEVSVPDLGLDVIGGAHLARLEMYGDWHRDPWGWPELTRLGKTTIDAEADLGVTAARRGEYHLRLRPHFHIVEVPKTRLGVRPAVVQDPLSRLAYLSAVHAGMSQLNSDLPDWVYGWRMREGKFATGRSEWAAYTDHLPNSDSKEFGLATDITSFFASIRPERVTQVVYSKLGRVASAHVIMDIVTAHDSLSTRSGLPQRSFGSSILAHAVLQPIDDALAAALLERSIFAVRRWMDDLSAEGSEEGLFALLVKLQERARHIGLELNASKTFMSEISQVLPVHHLEQLREIKVPTQAIANEYTGDTTYRPNVDVLLALEGTVLGNPRFVPRTLGRAVLVSLSDVGEFSRQAEWRAAAPHLPHVADALGRYLRGAAEADNSIWPELTAWFSEFQASAWGGLDWVASQLSLTFPTTQVGAKLQEVLRGWLETSSDLQKLAIAVQRLCTVQPVLGRDLIRARVDRTTDPLLLRVFALGLLTAGNNQAAVEAILLRDARNGLLSRHLEETRWEPPAISRDFDSATEAAQEP